MHCQTFTKVFAARHASTFVFVGILQGVFAELAGNTRFADGGFGAVGRVLDCSVKRNTHQKAVIDIMLITDSVSAEELGLKYSQT
jgi:hypothetical protein